MTTDNFETRIGRCATYVALRTVGMEADAEIARLQAQVDALAGALQAMMGGSVYRSIAGDEPDWHVITMPSRAALEKARIALAAVGR